MENYYPKTNDTPFIESISKALANSIENESRLIELMNKLIEENKSLRDKIESLSNAEVTK